MHKYQENHTIIATNGILTIYFFFKSEFTNKYIKFLDMYTFIKQDTNITKI